MECELVRGQRQTTEDFPLSSSFRERCAASANKGMIQFKTSLGLDRFFVLSIKHFMLHVDLPLL